MKKNLLVVGCISMVVAAGAEILTLRAIAKRKYRQGFTDGANCILTIHEINEALKETDESNKHRKWF